MATQGIYHCIKQLQKGKQLFESVFAEHNDISLKSPFLSSFEEFSHAGSEEDVDCDDNSDDDECYDENTIGVLEEIADFHFDQSTITYQYENNIHHAYFPKEISQLTFWNVRDVMEGNACLFIDLVFANFSKTKALLREKVWFPAIDEMVKRIIDSCIACQAVGQAAPPEPIQPSDMPSGTLEK